MIVYFAQLFRTNMSYFGRISVLFLISLFMNSCNVFESIEVGEVHGINFTKFDDRKVSFEVLIPIENPNGFSFKITGVDLDVIVNDEYLGKIKNVGDVLIHEKSDEIYTFPLDVEYSGSNILKGAFTLFSLFLDRKADVRVKGFILVKSFWYTKKLDVDEQSIVVIKPKT
jgi:LEA14-like dessication related protein